MRKHERAGFTWLAIVAVTATLAARPTEAGPRLKQYVAAQTPLYVEVDVDACRRLVAETAQLDGIARMGIGAARKPVAEVAEMAGASVEGVMGLLGRVRRVGFGLLGIGRDAPRILLVAEVAGDGPALDRLIQQKASRKYSRVTYLGSTIHAFRTGRGEGVWVTEVEGKIALGTDPIAVKTFLLRARALRGEAPPAGPRLLLWAEADVPAALNAVLPGIRRREREEFLMASAFLDFASWERLTVAFDGRRLEARLSINPDSPLAGALQGPDQPPQLLAAFSRDFTLTLVASVKDPARMARLVCSGIAQIHAIERSPERGQRTLEEIRREVGLDLEKDMLANLKESGYVVPVAKLERDLERRGVILLVARTDSAARAFVDAVVNKGMRRDGRDVKESRIHGAEVWKPSGGGMALKGRTIVVAPSRRAPLEEILKQLAGEQEFGRDLVRLYPGATSFAAFNPSRMMGGAPMPALTAGLSFKQGTLTLQSEIDVSGIVKAVGRAIVGEGIELPETTPPKRTRKLREKR